MEDRCPTDRVILDLFPWPTITEELWSCPIHKQKVKVEDHSVQKLEWKKTDGLLHYLPC